MKTIRVTVEFRVANHVTIEFIQEYFERMMREKIHEPASVVIEESEPEAEKL